MLNKKPLYELISEQNKILQRESNLFNIDLSKNEHKTTKKYKDTYNSSFRVVSRYV